LTTFPGRQADSFAARIKKMDRRLTVAETQVNNYKSITANLVMLVNALYARIGDPAQTGTAGLTEAQSVFLATLSQMAFIAHPPGGSLPDTNTQLDTLLDELQVQGYMVP